MAEEGVRTPISHRVTGVPLAHCPHYRHSHEKRYWGALLGLGSPNRSIAQQPQVSPPAGRRVLALVQSDTQTCPS